MGAETLALLGTGLMSGAGSLGSGIMGGLGSLGSGMLGGMGLGGLVGGAGAGAVGSELLGLLGAGLGNGLVTSGLNSLFGGGGGGGGGMNMLPVMTLGNSTGSTLGSTIGSTISGGGGMGSIPPSTLGSAIGGGGGSTPIAPGVDWGIAPPLDFNKLLTGGTAPLSEGNRGLVPPPPKPPEWTDKLANYSGQLVMSKLLNPRTPGMPTAPIPMPTIPLTPSSSFGNASMRPFSLGDYYS